MRRELKPTLRADTFRRAKTVTPPDTVEEGELIINIGSSTTLHFEGSPLMDPNLVSDPNAATPVPGADANYSTQDWVAIGLATDNITNATDDVNAAGQPIIGSGGDFQPPTGAGAELTAITPSRAALFFDLVDIPGDVEIIEAVLEMVPFENSDTLGDPYSQGADVSVWPNEGVQCEVVMLPDESTASATWNTLSGALVDFDDGSGTIFTLPDPADRWWRQTGGEFLPNPIGIPQNTRRSDIAEPNDRFLDQAQIDSSVAQSIDGDETGVADEYYGHIGYGILGGGYAADASLLRPTFNISNADWTTHRSGSLDPISVDVVPLVEYGIANGNKANFLLRAANVGENTALTNPNDQLRFDDDPEIDPLIFTTAILSDVSDGSAIVEIDNDQELFVVTDIQNADSVTYEWLIELPYVDIDGLDVTTSGDLEEGGTVSISSITVERGGVASPDSDDVINFTFTVGSATSTNASITIPDDAAGQDLTVEVTVTNDVNSDTFTDTVTIGTVAVDGAGSFTLTRVSPAGSTEFTPVLEGTVAQVEAIDITGVANPQFTYRWFHGLSPNSEDNSTLLDEFGPTNSVVSTRTAPEGEWDSFLQFLVCKATLFEGGSPIAGSEQFIAWTLDAVDDPPPGEAVPNGIYKVDNVAISRNCSPDQPDEPLRPYESFVTEGCSVPVFIEEPTQVGACDQNSGQYGVPFGYIEHNDELIRITNSELDRFQSGHSGARPSGLIGFASKGNGDTCGRRFKESTNADSNECRTGNGFHMLTRNGFNGTVDDIGNPGGIRPGDVAVWIPEFSETNGWIIMHTVDRQPVNRLNGTPNGLVTKGVSATDSFVQFADNYGSFDGSSCVFADLRNHHIAWNVKKNVVGEDDPSNALDAEQFIQNMDPTPIFTGSEPDFHNPQTRTNGKLNNIYLIFFDKDLLPSQYDGVINTDIFSIDPDYESTSGGGGGGGGGGEPPETGIPLPSSSIASTANPDAVAIGAEAHMTYRIDNFADVNLNESGELDNGRSAWLVPSNVTVDDTNGGAFFRASVATDPLATDTNVTVERFKDISGVDGTEFEGITYNTVQIGYNNKAHNEGANPPLNWTGYSTVSMGYLTPFMLQTVPSDKKIVVEVIRNDVVVGRNKYDLSQKVPNNIDVLFASNNRHDRQYKPEAWEINDLIVVTVVNNSYSFTQIDI